MIRRSVLVIVIKQRKGHNVAMKKLVCYWSFFFAAEGLKRKGTSSETAKVTRDNRCKAGKSRTRMEMRPSDRDQ